MMESWMSSFDRDSWSWQWVAWEWMAWDEMRSWVDWFLDFKERFLAVKED